MLQPLTTNSKNIILETEGSLCISTPCMTHFVNVGRTLEISSTLFDPKGRTAIIWGTDIQHFFTKYQLCSFLHKLVSPTSPSPNMLTL